MSDFGTLYFKKETNKAGKPTGKFAPLRARFLYESTDLMPAGRVHQYFYSDKRSARVLCLTDGMTKAQAEKTDCPLCKVGKYPGRPGLKYYAFVEDLDAEGTDDDKRLKMFEMPYKLAEQVQETADVKGRPLHDLTFILTKKSNGGTDVVYTAVLDETEKFNVGVFLSELGLTELPTFVSDTSGYILKLSKEKIDSFLDGNYPWSTEDYVGKAKRYTPLGATITVHGNVDELPAQFEDEDEEEVKPVKKEVKKVVEDLDEEEEVVPVKATRKTMF